MSLDWVFRDDVDEDGFPTERELIRVRREQEARGLDAFGRPIPQAQDRDTQGRAVRVERVDV